MADEDSELLLDRSTDASAKTDVIAPEEVKSLQEGATEQAGQRLQFLKESYRRSNSNSTEFVFAVIDKLGQASLSIYDGAKRIVGALTGEMPKVGYVPIASRPDQAQAEKAPAVPDQKSQGEAGRESGGGDNAGSQAGGEHLNKSAVANEGSHTAVIDNQQEGKTLAPGPEQALDQHAKPIQPEADKLDSRLKGLPVEQERQARQDLADIDRWPEAQRKRIYESLDKLATSRG